MLDRHTPIGKGITYLTSPFRVEQNTYKKYPHSSTVRYQDGSVMGSRATIQDLKALL